MQDLNDLYFYVQIVDNSGLAPAGRVLGVPKSTLSRRLAALEERLGVRLIPSVRALIDYLAQRFEDLDED